MLFGITIYLKRINLIQHGEIDLFMGAAQAVKREGEGEEEETKSDKCQGDIRHISGARKTVKRHPTVVLGRVTQYFSAS